MPVTHSQSVLTEKKRVELTPQPGFAETFLVQGRSPATGSIFYQKRLAQTLSQIAKKGTNDYYRGELAELIAKELQKLGSPLRLEDLHRHRAKLINPLHLSHSLGDVYNMTPPTQGVVSLMILGILDQLKLKQYSVDSPEYVHHCVEATKQAFKVRDQHITDPVYMKNMHKNFCLRVF